MALRESTVSILTGKQSEQRSFSAADKALLEDDDTVTVRYKPEETILDLKRNLETLKGYPVDEQQLHSPAARVEDMTLIQQVAQENGRLYLKRVSMATSAAVNQSQSSHSYTKIKTEESNQQYMGNIGILPNGKLFRSHKYSDISGSGQSVQVMGDMASFPPGFGATRQGQ